VFHKKTLLIQIYIDNSLSSLIEILTENGMHQARSTEVHVMLCEALDTAVGEIPMSPMNMEGMFIREWQATAVSECVLCEYGRTLIGIY
jgi:hypothetical protein